MIKYKRTLGSTIFDTVNIIILLLLCLATVYPFLHMVAVSFSDKTQVLNNKVTFYPKGFVVDAYMLVFKDNTIWRAYINTIVYTLSDILISVLGTAMFAYPLSKKYLWGRGPITFFITFTMFFSGGMIPSFLLVKSLHMYNTMWAIIIPGCIGVYNVIIMRTFFQNLPQSLDESARLDGASEMNILFRIYLPLSLPVCATIALWVGLGQWNNFMGPLIYFSDQKKYSLQILLRQMIITGDQVLNPALAEAFEEEYRTVPDSLKYATILVATAPVLVAYPFLQKYFVKGMLVGSIKG